MNFELTQQQAAIQETARKFAQEELLPGVLERDANSEFPVEQFHKMRTWISRSSISQRSWRTGCRLSFLCISS